MNTQQKLLLTLSFCALFFSSMLGFRYQITPNIEAVDYWFRLIPLPILDYNGISDLKHLDTKILGYVFFLINALILFFKVKYDRILLPALIIFFFSTGFAIFFEIWSLFQYLNGNYAGQSLYIGPFLFLFNLSIIKSYPRRLELRKYSL